MIKGVLAFVLLFLIVFSSFAYAVGTSSGGSSSSRTRNREVNSSASANAVATTCETYSNIESRIRCRFQNKAVAERESYNVVEEACRGHANATISACENLYKRSHACYDMTSPVAKKRCFLNESGININMGGTFRAAPAESKRNYVVLLLYDLQERIEHMQEEGQLTAEEATSLVSQIVEIKRMIISGQKRSDIVLKINEFKTEYRTVVGDSK